MSQLKSLSYRPDIDGLRALAILAVVFYHYFPSAFPGGFIGVDIFFVISGYLISNIIFKELDLNDFSFLRFYAKRTKRIFPALIFLLILILIFAWFLLPSMAYKEMGRELKYAAIYLENFYLINHGGGYFDTSILLKPLMHLWSLSIEEQYYLIYPLVLFVAWKLNAKWRLLLLGGIVALSFCLSVYLVDQESFQAYFSLPSRFWELGCGGLLAYVERYSSILNVNERIARQFSYIALLLFIFCIVGLSSEQPFPGFLALCPVLLAMLFILAKGSLVNEKLLSHNLFVFIGLVSYPWYLWHWSLFSLMSWSYTEVP